MNRPPEEKYSKTHPKVYTIEKEIIVYNVASVVHDNANYRVLLATVSSSDIFRERRKGRKEGRKQDKARGSIIGQFRVHYRC